MKRVRIGAIRGRHKLPVSRYLFNVPWLSTGPDLVRETRLRVRRLYEAGVREVDFYPTGLSQVSVEAVAEMVRLGMDVRVFHYDPRHGSYFAGRPIRIHRRKAL